jgi:hypothetical protein
MCPLLDWMGEYPDTPSQPFQLREFRTGQLVGVMASSIRDLQILAQQHFSVRDPVIATDGAALNYWPSFQWLLN